MLFAASHILSTINIQGSNLEELQKRISVLGFFELVLCTLSVTIKSSVLVSYMYKIMIAPLWTKAMFSYNREDWDDTRYHIGTDCGYHWNSFYKINCFRRQVIGLTKMGYFFRIYL